MSTERAVATLLAEYLRRAGVRHVFGYPGKSVVDFMEAACDGVVVESVAGLEKALAPAFSGRARPLVIEARIDPSQYAVQF